MLVRCSKAETTLRHQVWLPDSVQQHPHSLEVFTEQLGAAFWQLPHCCMHMNACCPYQWHDEEQQQWW